jgi:hypothetical protein
MGDQYVWLAASLQASIELLGGLLRYDSTKRLRCPAAAFFGHRAFYG